MFLNLRNYLVTSFLFSRKNLVMYLGHVVFFVIIPDKFTCSLCSLSVKWRESLICKSGASVLDCVEYFHYLFYSHTRGLISL